MYTRKRRRKRKTKRGGLGPEVYVMTGMMTVLNGLMMSFGPSVGSYNPCDKDLPAEAIPVDDSVAKPIDDK